MFIKRFIIDHPQSLLTFEWESETQNKLLNKLSPAKQYPLSFEYLRVHSLKEPFNSAPRAPVDHNTPTQGGKPPPKPVSHKKTVKLVTIECVGKHGYRFIFDDQHQAIYSSEYLKALCKEEHDRWRYYLEAMKDNGLSREEMISFKQV